MTKQRTVSTRTIQRAIWIAGVALAISVAAFAGYYIWDRYIHVGDRSPVELNIAHIEQAVQDDPQNPAARVALADSHLQAGEYDKALEQTDQVLQVYPDDEGALLIAGIAHVRLNRPEAALAPLEHFVALRKDQPMANVDSALEAAYYFLGESYIKLERHAEAIPILEAALAISATDADALYQLGLAYQATGQPELALACYHKAVRLVPDFAEVYSGMVASYTSLGQSDHVTYARGMEAFSQRDYRAAATDLEYASQALPDFGPAFLGLGLTYEKLGQMDQARAAVQQAIELNPDDFAAQQALGRIEAALGTKK